MNIEAKDFEIKMTYGELWSLAFDVRLALEYTLKTHWVNHQESWKQNEAERLNRCESMFLALGRPDLHKDILSKAETIFKDFNEKK